MKKVLLILLLLPLYTGAQIITTFAGSRATTYGGDGGPADSAFLDLPSGVAVDAAGNIYVADAGNNRIRKVTPAGIISTYAGNGAIGYSGDGGPADSAEMNNPSAIAIDLYGNLYIADAGNNRIRKINTSGIITTVAGNGTAGFSGDGGPAISAQLSGPSGVAIDKAGNIYIADQTNERIRKVSTGGIITTIAGNGATGFSGDGGAATSAKFHNPAGVAVDTSGNIYIADELNARIRKINTSGIISTIAGTGTFAYGGDGGPATSAELYQPTAVSVDTLGNVFIGDLSNNRVRKINAAGTITTLAGSGPSGFSGDGAIATSALLHSPSGVTTDATGNVFIADVNNNRVRKVNTSGIISTIAGYGIAGYGDGGPATSAQLSGPHDVAIDAIGNVYIADKYHNLIRKVDTSGIISTYAGNGIGGYNGDGGPAINASLNQPIGITVDDTGNLYICDVSNQRIRKVNTAGIISTIAGTGAIGYSGDGGPATAARLGDPQYIILDNTGNIYFSDQNSLVRKINTAGIISTVAGIDTMGYGGDGGPATVAKFRSPLGIAKDGSGNLYIGDLGNQRVRKVNTSGIVNTIAGNGTAGYAGDGGPCAGAEFHFVGTVSVDLAGTLFIADMGNNRIREIDTTGIITTIAGNGSYGYSGDGGLATAAELKGPTSARPDNRQHLYIADFQNNVIRKVSFSLRAITGTTVLCTGTSVTLHDSLAGGTWSSNNTAVAYIGSASGYASGITAGTSMITYTTAAGYVTTIITVNPGPAVITGMTSVCAGAATPLTNATPGGTWSSSATGIATVNATTGNVTGISPGGATITYTAGGCFATISMAVNPSGVATPWGCNNVGVGDTLLFGLPTGYGYSTSSYSILALSGGYLVGMSPGTATVYMASPTGCSTGSVTITVTATPLIYPFTGRSQISAGDTAQMHETTPGGLWSSSSAAEATVSTTGLVHAIVTGNPFITYSVSGGVRCTEPIYVISLPTPITGPSSVCVGDTIMLSSFVSYYWSDVGLGGIFTSHDTSIGKFVRSDPEDGYLKGISPGIDTITFADVEGPHCFVTTIITVNAIPSAGAITGATSLCVGIPATLSDIATGGIWSSGSAGIATAGSTGTVTGIMAGTATISYSVSNSCGSAVATKTVTINPLPTVGAISGIATVCASFTTTLSDTTLGGTWSSVATGIATIGSTGIVTGVLPGTDTIRYSVTNSCATAVAIEIVTVNTVSAGAITGLSGVCAGATVILSDGIAGGVWSSGSTGIATAGSTGIITGISAGIDTVKYTVTNSCGIAVARAVVTVEPLPEAGVITGTGSVCVSSTTSLGDSVGGGVWTSGATGTATTGTSGVVSGISAGTAVISYSVTNTCGTAYTSTTITVNPLPDAGVITGPDTLCVLNTLTLTDSIPGGTWTASNFNAFVAGGGLVLGFLAGTDTIIYTTTNICGTARAKQLITIINCTTGVNNITERAKDINLYPNPATTSLTISSTNEPINEVTISNIMGQAVRSWQSAVGSKQLTIDIADLAPGVYFVKVDGDPSAGLRMTGKFLKE